MKGELIKIDLEAGDDWLKKDNYVEASICFGSAIMNFLSLSLTNYDKENGIKFLKENQVKELLMKLVDIIKKIYSMIQSKEKPSSVLGGNYDLIVFSHIGWLLNDNNSSEILIEISNSKELNSFGTDFWRAYAHAVLCFVEKKEYSPENLKLRGQEKYWQIYLKLISDITNSRDISEKRQKMEDLFKKRNQDKRIKDDNFEIEGSGLCPVKWDFRGESILHYAAREYGLIT